MKDNPPLSLAFCFNSSYLLPLSVTLYSIFLHLPQGETAHLYFVDGGVGQKNKTKIEKMLKQFDDHEVRWFWVDPILDSDQYSNEWIKGSTLRLNLPLVLSDLHKVIYLDCDLIVEANLMDLWEEDIAENLLLAVRDPGIPVVSASNGLPHSWGEYGFDPDDHYFNAGIMVINLEKFRSLKVASQCMKYFEAHARHINHWDQEALNAVVRNRWRALDARWNLFIVSLISPGPKDYAFQLEAENQLFEINEKGYILHLIGARHWSNFPFNFLRDNL